MADWFQQLVDWVLRWDQPGTLGDILPWFISGLVSAASALLIYFRRRAEKRREQALKVTAWIDARPRGGYVMRVRNSSLDRIEKVAALVAQPDQKNPEDINWDLNAQLFTVPTIGPERSIDFPLSRSLTNNELALVRLYFLDRGGNAWVLYETGRLVRLKRGVVDAFFSGPNIGRSASVLDHSGTLGVDNNPTELADVPISRIDLDNEDGNNVTVTLVPKGADITITTVAELSRGNKRAARIYFDKDEHILQVTICNLPAGMRDRIFPDFSVHDGLYRVYFGTKDSSIDEKISLERLRDAWVLGGKHTPFGELGWVSHDAAGHLQALIIPVEYLVPGFLTDDKSSS
ncbi:hypothetical protein [Pseudarthrobacter sp. NCCP-2145]|uniref:hypothetical protein n=1 Tax=Pseudarthrobacter sp. NCCP-2145 TaxID=2942290 RepID=UPI00203C41A8|nr:hypothetical protein [Pseudarthrobacter sp. NCCP-2145]GKV72027.1 hypothetical protein NCCP2145_14080 [Pseudarthrobacter sp. NCCP-2145]